ncbi:2696_t:CDS:2 [Ambispora gerdemannii]|uniref:2696_t:CDS:1 n=1 Tax=Ambispora gerdemannii TaxID=144530 RepID=A0A9N8V1J6_9GLOM|nr:2696_t:CDS:2 [Ambispora gerdemannii]
MVTYDAEPSSVDAWKGYIEPNEYPTTRWNLFGRWVSYDAEPPSVNAWKEFLYAAYITSMDTLQRGTSSGKGSVRRLLGSA